MARIRTRPRNIDQCGQHRAGQQQDKPEARETMLTLIHGSTVWQDPPKSLMLCVWNTVNSRRKGGQTDGHYGDEVFVRAI